MSIKQRLEAEWLYLTTLPRPLPWLVIGCAVVLVALLVLVGCDPLANSR
jgi:hypothetical protein